MQRDNQADVLSRHDNTSASEKPPKEGNTSPGCLLRILRVPVVRIMVGTAWLIVAIIMASLLAELVPIHNSHLKDFLSMVLVLMAAYGAYVSFVHIIERRSAGELAFSGATLELAWGILTGAALFIIIIGFLWALGYYSVEGFNPWMVIMPVFISSVLAGFVEEVFFRGVLFRISEESLGTWLALILTALIFGLMHGGNPNATLLTTSAITIEAGVLLGGAYVITRRLWFVTGVHFAWNFVQGGVFGVPVSGHEFQGLIEGTLTGPTLLTGGEFGVEASIVTVIVCSIVGAGLLKHAHRKGRFIRPFWRRDAQRHPAGSFDSESAATE